MPALRRISLPATGLGVLLAAVTVMFASPVLPSGSPGVSVNPLAAQSAHAAPASPYCHDNGGSGGNKTYCITLYLSDIVPNASQVVKNDLPFSVGYIYLNKCSTLRARTVETYVDLRASRFAVKYRLVLRTGHKNTYGPYDNGVPTSTKDQMKLPSTPVYEFALDRSKVPVLFWRVRVIDKKTGEVLHKTFRLRSFTEC